MSIDKLEIHYRLLKILEGNPNLTQRRMAREMGLSLGKFNHCLKELVEKDFVKVKRFTSSDNRAAYMYPLTPQGIEEKNKVTAKFLKRKMTEFETIKQQIEELQQEVRGENRYTV
jgi:EPS-associated MarR family transcriptional regulator